jgi:transposase
VQKTRAGGKKRKKYTNKNALLLGRIPRAETAGSWVKNKKNTRTKVQPPLTEERAGGKKQKSNLHKKKKKNKKNKIHIINTRIKYL